MAPHFFIEDICVEAIAAAKRAYEHGDLRPRLARYHGANVDNAFYGWNGAWLDENFRRWDITDALHHIRVPLLVLQGLADPYGTRAQADVVDELCTAPVSVELLDQVGHAPWQEAEATTLAAIQEFAAKILQHIPLSRT